MRYNWQQQDWPLFRYDLSGAEDDLLAFAERTGRARGLLSGLNEEDQLETSVEMMVAEAIKTSAIEGELLSRRDVMSSIRRNLGLDGGARAGDRRAEGAAALMVDARKSFAKSLSEEKLFEWHRMIMSGSRHIEAGLWRNHPEPMQVISGPAGKEKVHFEALPSSRVPDEMNRFIRWFNETAPGGNNEIRKAVVRSAVAHLYFESIHPFEDGNGRIGRALSEKALSQGAGRPVLLSLSRAIEADKKRYYKALQEGQGSNDISSWVKWFAAMALSAQIQAEEHIEFTLNKSRLFNRFSEQLNERQLQILRRMLEEGPEGFEGGMSAKKYMSITGASKPTATRDLQDLTDKRIFEPFGAGRSTRYRVAF
jgi:Fic family protein